MVSMYKGCYHWCFACLLLLVADVFYCGEGPLSHADPNPKQPCPSQPLHTRAGSWPSSPNHNPLHPLGDVWHSKRLIIQARPIRHFFWNSSHWNPFRSETKTLSLGSGLREKAAQEDASTMRQDAEVTLGKRSRPLSQLPPAPLPLHTVVIKTNAFPLKLKGVWVGFCYLHSRQPDSPTW